MNIAILGAGVSGLSIGKFLSEKHDITIYEKNKTVGGLARTRFTNGYLYDPYGGHIFNSKKEEVVDWVFKILPKENWQWTVRNAKIYFDGKFVSYPFELSLFELEVDIAVDSIYDFIMSKEGEEPNNYKDWLYWNFGKSIADYYMIPYNEKIWSYDLTKMETSWMRGKMPLPTKKEMIKSMFLKDPSERKMPHSTFYYPLNGGIQSLMDKIAEGLNIKLESKIKKIRKDDNNKWAINDDKDYDMIISTIPLPELLDIMTLPDEIVKSIKDLKYNSLNTALFTCPKTDITWLYIPSHKYRAHRIGYQSTLTPNFGPNKDEGLGAFEVIGERIDFSKYNNYDEFVPHELIGENKVFDSEWTKYAYVIYDTNYQKNTTTIKDYFKKDSSFKLLGRWGTWNFNNMDLCINDSMNLAKEIDNSI